jgi:hypothetical protein
MLSLILATWYATFDGAIPEFIYSACEALNLNYSILKNTTEGSSGSADAARNKFRERLRIMLPENLDGMPNLVEDLPPPEYTDPEADKATKAKRKRNIFDTLSMCIN